MRRDAKSYLESVRAAMRREELLNERLELAKSKIDGPGAINYNDTPGNPNANTDGVHVMVEHYMSIVKKLEQQQAFTGMLFEQAFTGMLFEQAFDMLQEMRDAGIKLELCDVLEFYYLWDLTPEAIGQKTSTTASRVRGQISEALKIAESYIPMDAA